MSDFDKRFADRVREVFDAYEEPVDPAALARMKAALGTSRGAPPAPSPAPDRAPVRGARASRGTLWRMGAAAALAVLALGLWLMSLPGTAPGPETARDAVASADSPAARTEPDDADRATPDASETASDPSAALAEGEPSRPDLAVASGPPTASRADAPRADASRADASRRPTSRSVVTPQIESPVPLGEGEGVEPAVAGAVVPSTGERPGVDSGLAEAASETEAARARSVVLVAEAPPSAPVTRPALADSDRGSAGRGGLGIVVAATSAFSDGALADGAGASAGLAYEQALGRGLFVSAGALAAYNRFTVEPETQTLSLTATDIASQPSRSIDVPEQSTLTTLALELPVDVALDVARAPGGRLGVSVGLTSAVYLAQTFEDEGDRLTAEVTADRETGVATFEVQSEPFDSREEQGAFSRVDLARQLGLALRFTSDGRALAVEAYGRLPLGGLTSREIPLTTAGLRLRYTLR